MRTGRIYAVLALAVLCTLTIVATGVWADPADVDNPPTEDWVFDEGRTTTLSGATWDVEYNITVTGGSTLNIDTSTWTIGSTLGTAPVWISVESDSSLSIDTSTLISSTGSNGFYITVYGEISLTNCDLTGLVENPANEGAISIFNGKAYLHTVKISDCFEANALYALNSNVSIWWSTFTDIDKGAIRFIMDSIPQGEDRYLTIWNSHISIVGASGVRMSAYSSYGHGELYIDGMSMDNTTGAGVWVEQGDGTAADHGTGSMNVTIKDLSCRDIGGDGILTTSHYQDGGPGGMGSFNVVASNIQIERCDGAGIRNLVFESDIAYRMDIEYATIADIAKNVDVDGLQGLVLEHTNRASAGTVNVSVNHSTIERCAWGGFLDKGNNDMVTIHNTTFRDNVGYGVYANIPRYGIQSAMAFSACSFIDNDGYGIELVSEVQPAGGGAIYDVLDSEFIGNTGPGLALVIRLSVRTNQPLFVGFNVTDSTFEDSPDTPAILMDLYRLVGDARLDLRGSMLDGTNGIQVIGGIGIDCDVRMMIEDTVITNNTGSAIDVAAQANTKTLLNVTLDGLSAHSLTGDAVTLSNDMARVQTTTVTSMVYIWNSVIVSDKGTALWVSTNGKHQNGITSISLENTTMDGMNRALVLRGHDGQVNGCTFHGRLLEDILAIDSVISLRHADLSGPLEDKVIVMTRGEVKLFCTLQVYVTWSSNAPAVGATVMVRDNALTTLAIRSAQDPDGRISQLVINTYIVQASGVVTRNPYTINASFSGVATQVGLVLEEDTEITVILHDSVAPDVHILSPESGSIQQSSVIRVVGTAWDYQSELASVRISVDGENWTTIEGATSWNVKINVTNETIDRFDGRIVVQVVATDNAGNDAMDATAVRIIQRPPGVTVYFPPDGYVTNEASLKVSGVTDQGALVRINGVPVDVLVTMFEATLTLVEGENTISIMSTDILGNTAVVRLKVTLDTRPPYVVLSNPSGNVVTNLNTMTVVAVLENDLQVEVNGESVAYGSDWYPLDSGRLEYPVSLVEDENNIVIWAMDPAGNTIRISRQVLFDSEPPWIEVTRPTEGMHVSSHYVEVMGTVDPTAVLRLNGEVVTTADGIFMVSISAAEGANTLVFWAVDGAGNERTMEIGFTVDTEMPSLVLTSPTEDPQVVTTSRFQITGTVESAGMVTATSLTLDGYPFTTIDDGAGGETIFYLAISEEDGTFEIPVDLADGLNEMTVEVWDATGNSASITVRLVLDTKAPLLTVLVNPSRTRDDGTIETWDRNIHITGSTEPDAALELNGVRIVVAEDGTYEAYYKLSKDSDTLLSLTSVDKAGNVRMWEEVMTYKVSAEESEDGSPWALIGGLVVFLVLVVIAIMYVRSRSPEGGEANAPEGDEGMSEDEEVVVESDELEEMLDEIEGPEGGER